MNFTKIIKPLLDIAMAVVFALLFNKTVLGGLSFHEIAGLALGLAILIHLLLNWKLIRLVTLNILKPKISFGIRIGYVLNILLGLAFAFIIVSGILISTVVFPGIKIENPYIIGRLHVAISYLAIMLLGVHLGLHWDWIVVMFKKISRMPARKNRVLSYTVNAIIILIFIFGSYQIYTANYFSQVSMIVRSSDKEILFKDGMKAPLDKGRIEIPKDNESKQKLIDELKKQGRIILEEGGTKDGVGQGKSKIGEERSDSNIWKVLSTYLSVIAVFTIITGIVEKLLRRRRSILKVSN